MGSLQDASFGTSSCPDTKVGSLPPKTVQAIPRPSGVCQRSTKENCQTFCPQSAAAKLKLSLSGTASPACPPNDSDHTGTITAPEIPDDINARHGSWKNSYTRSALLRLGMPKASPGQHVGTSEHVPAERLKPWHPVVALQLAAWELRCMRLQGGIGS